MATFSATVHARVAADRAAAFAFIAPIDLPSVFTGYGPLPAVVAVEDQSGGWDAAGQSRTLRLSDGNRARERLVRYEPPDGFGYAVEGFTGVFGRLTRRAQGDWWFRPQDAETITIEWRYAFEARNAWVAPVLWWIVRMFWRSYMRKALAAMVDRFGRSG